LSTKLNRSCCQQS